MEILKCEKNLENFLKFKNLEIWKNLEISLHEIALDGLKICLSKCANMFFEDYALRSNTLSFINTLYYG